MAAKKYSYQELERALYPKYYSSFFLSVEEATDRNEEQIRYRIPYFCCGSDTIIFLQEFADTSNALRFHNVVYGTVDRKKSMNDVITLYCEDLLGEELIPHIIIGKRTVPEHYFNVTEHC